MTQSDVNKVPVETVVPVTLDLAQEFKEKHRLADQVFKGAIAALICNAAVIMILAFTLGSVFAGKIVLIEVMLMFALICLGIAIGHGKIMDLLTQAEEIAYLARDQAFVDLNMAREELAGLRRKLSREVDDQGYGGVGELLKTVSPLVMMFIQKEKNLFRWGMFGLKVAQNAMAVIKQRSKKS
jgi:hypothetical protein